MGRNTKLLRINCGGGVGACRSSPSAGALPIPVCQPLYWRAAEWTPPGHPPGVEMLAWPCHVGGSKGMLVLPSCSFPTYQTALQVDARRGKGEGAEMCTFLLLCFHEAEQSFPGAARCPSSLLA